MSQHEGAPESMQDASKEVLAFEREMAAERAKFEREMALKRAAFESKLKESGFKSGADCPNRGTEACGTSTLLFSPLLVSVKKIQSFAPSPLSLSLPNSYASSFFHDFHYPSLC